MIERITSRQNARVKDAVKLRTARGRAEQGRLLIDGVREISRALNANIEVATAFVCPELLSDDDARRTSERFSEKVRIDVTSEVFEKLSFGQRADGLVVVAHTPNRSLDKIVLPDEPLVAVLVGLEKPGNVGAILRTADGAGIDAVLVVDGATDLWNPNTIRASLGTIFSLQVATASIEQTVEKLRAWQLPMFATRPDATRCYTDVDYRKGAAMVLGSEAAGISAQWPKDNVTPISLPMQGVADSLNVSATAAAIFYEAVRQRNC